MLAPPERRERFLVSVFWKPNQSYGSLHAA